MGELIEEIKRAIIDNIYFLQDIHNRDFNDSAEEEAAYYAAYVCRGAEQAINCLKMYLQGNTNAEQKQGENTILYGEVAHDKA